LRTTYSARADCANTEAKAQNKALRRESRPNENADFEKGEEPIGRSAFPVRRMRGLAEGETFDGGGDAAFVVGKSFVPAVRFEFGNAISHDDGDSGDLEHFEIVVIVADGENFVSLESLAGGPLGEGAALGAIAGRTSIMAKSRGS